jgi:hypothetical protein
MMRAGLRGSRLRCAVNPQVTLCNSTGFEEFVQADDALHLCEEQAVDQLCKLMNSSADEGNDPNTNNCTLLYSHCKTRKYLQDYSNFL